MGTLFQDALTPGGALINTNATTPGDFLNVAKLNEIRDMFGDYDLDIHPTLYDLIGGADYDPDAPDLHDLGVWTLSRPYYTIAKVQGTTLSHGDLVYYAGTDATETTITSWNAPLPYVTKHTGSQDIAGVYIAPLLVNWRDTWPQAPDADDGDYVVIGLGRFAIACCEFTGQALGTAVYCDHSTGALTLTDTDNIQVGIIVTNQESYGGDDYNGWILFDIPVSPATSVASGVVDTNQLADEAVTEAKLADELRSLILTPKFLSAKDFVSCTGSPTRTIRNSMWDVWSLPDAASSGILSTFINRGNLGVSQSYTIYIWCYAVGAGGDFDIMLSKRGINANNLHQPETSGGTVVFNGTITPVEGGWHFLQKVSLGTYTHGADDELRSFKITRDGSGDTASSALYVLGLEFEPA